MWKAIKLQLISGNCNWLLGIEELHSCFVSLHVIAKYIETSGIDPIYIESGLYSPAKTCQIFARKYCKHGIGYHCITKLIVCQEFSSEASSQDPDLKEFIIRCQELQNKLYTREFQTDAHILFDEIASMLTNKHFK